MGPAVRTASLVERRGFEPPVLFVVPGAYERLEVSAGVTALKPIRELFSERSGGKLWPRTAGLRPFSKGEKAKEDRRFESPPLHQRVTANQLPALR